MSKLVSSHVILGVLAVVALALYGVMIIVGSSVPSGFVSITYGLVAAFSTGTGYAIGQKTAQAPAKTTSIVSGS